MKHRKTAEPAGAVAPPRSVGRLYGPSPAAARIPQDAPVPQDEPRSARALPDGAWAIIVELRRRGSATEALARALLAEARDGTLALRRFSAPSWATLVAHVQVADPRPPPWPENVAAAHAAARAALLGAIYLGVMAYTPEARAALAQVVGDETIPWLDAEANVLRLLIDATRVTPPFGQAVEVLRPLVARAPCEAARADASADAIADPDAEGLG